MTITHDPNRDALIELSVVLANMKHAEIAAAAQVELTQAVLKLAKRINRDAGPDPE